MGCLLAIAAFAIGTLGGWAANLTGITVIANIGLIWSLIWTFVIAPVGWWWGRRARTVRYMDQVHTGQQSPHSGEQGPEREMHRH